MRAQAHNEVVALVRRKTPRYVRQEDPQPVHPWQTKAAWNAAEKRWEARVRPGFVNGMDPMVPGVEVEREDWDPATGKAADRYRTATLCDEAGIPLHGFGAGFEKISKAARIYFEKRGAVERKEEENYAVNDLGMVTFQDTDQGAQPDVWRPLRSVDLYLAQARPSLRGVVDIVDGTGLTGQVAQYSSTYDTAMLDLHGYRARLQQAPKYPGNAAKPTAKDILAGNYTDDGEDRQPVCTVFLLGPQLGWDEEAPEPDGSWTAHVQHHLFWNVMYASRYEPPARPPAPIRLTTGLALADTLGNQIMAPTNDLVSRVMAAFNARSPEGSFYTI